jgi:hypothetical protein
MPLLIFFVTTILLRLKPVDLIIIANEKGRQAYLHEDWLQNILMPDLQQACQGTNKIITLFPNNTSSQENAISVDLPTPPTRPLPRNRPPAITTTSITKRHNIYPPITITTPNKVDTPHPPIRKTPWPPEPSLQQIGQHIYTPTRGGTATGLEALLKAIHHINTYA